MKKKNVQSTLQGGIFHFDTSFDFWPNRFYTYRGIVLSSPLPIGVHSTTGQHVMPGSGLRSG